jgi:NDP-sugar pyrophosphorylase family protein
MKCLIFAAGLGTRLKPLTDTMPKAMVPVGGKPLVQILIEKLKSEGFDEIVINVHHFASQITDFVKRNNMFGVDIKFSDETDMLLETGGGVKKASSLFVGDEPFLIHNVDILSNLCLAEVYGKMSEVFAAGEPGALLVVSERVSSRYLLFDESNRLVGWTNAKTGEVKTPYPGLDISKCRKYAFSGIHVFSKRLVDYMDKWEGKFSIIDFYLSVCADVKIYGYLKSGLQLVDVGKLDTLKEAEKFLERIS